MLQEVKHSLIEELVLTPLLHLRAEKLNVT